MYSSMSMVERERERERKRETQNTTSLIETLQYHTYIQVREIRTDAQYITYS